MSISGTLEDLFTNEKYEIQNFKLGDKRLALRVLHAATTDYDLTGQIIWPAALLLAQYLADNPALMSQRSCAVELGSGLGLVGILCGQFLPTYLTDHNDIILRVLRDNADCNKGSHAIRCCKLDWTSELDIARQYKLSPGGQGYELVLGADVCYSLKALPFLFYTISRLLSRKNGSLCLIGYVSRSAALDKGLLIESSKLGLLIKEVDGSRKGLAGGLEGMIYEVTWAEEGGLGKMVPAVAAGLGAILTVAAAVAVGVYTRK